MRLIGALVVGLSVACNQQGPSAFTVKSQLFASTNGGATPNYAGTLTIALAEAALGCGQSIDGGHLISIIINDLDGGTHLAGDYAVGPCSTSEACWSQDFELSGPYAPGFEANSGTVTLTNLTDTALFGSYDVHGLKLDQSSTWEETGSFSATYCAP